MKTLHAIKNEPTFLEYMESRFRGIHADWEYRGNQVWYRPNIRTDTYTQLQELNYWNGLYETWLAKGAPDL